MSPRGTEPPDTNPSTPITLEALFAERDAIVSVALLCGVFLRDLEDVVVDVIHGAYEVALDGRYRPDPRLDPTTALRAFLRACAWRAAMRWRDLPHRRREVPSEEPFVLDGEPSADPEGRLLARDAMRVLDRLPASQREVLLLTAAGHTAEEIGAMLGISPNTAANRLRLAKKHARLALQRWRKV